MQLIVQLIAIQLIVPYLCIIIHIYYILYVNMWLNVNQAALPVMRPQLIAGKFAITIVIELEAQPDLKLCCVVRSTYLVW